MKATSPRIVLGFYSGNEAEAERAIKAARSVSRKASLINNSKVVPERLKRYAALRLAGETLVVAEAEPWRVDAIVKLFQGAGSPAVFVVRPDLDRMRQSVLENRSTRPEVNSHQDCARACAARRDRLDRAGIDFLARLQEHEKSLDYTVADLTEAARLGHALTAAAEWMLDNTHLVRIQHQEIRRHLPRNYSKILPVLTPGYDLAQEMVVRTDYSLNQADISEWLKAYQEVYPLTIAEIWLFPVLLRMALIEALCELGVRVNLAQELREEAYLWANRLVSAARRGPEESEGMLHRMETEPFALEPYFVTSLVEQLQDEEHALAPVQHWIEDRLKTPVTDLARTEHSREAVDSLLTANVFGSLRALSRIDFNGIFEGVSLVEAELRVDPTYAASDFTTRDQCCHVVERISRYSSVSELEVAKRAVELGAASNDSQKRHAAYYLLAEGVIQLEAATGSRLPLRMRFIRAVRQSATEVYQGGVIGLTVCFIGIALALAWDGGVHHTAMLAILGALALFPLSEVSVQIVNALVISLLPPEPLPRMDFRKGIPAEHATLVVVPMMLSSDKVICQEIEKLEVRFLANRDPNLFFALLSDFKDANNPVTPDDAKHLRQAREGIAGLNARYPGRFLLFHRERIWSESEGMWIGRERKRGKIEDLNEFLSGAGSGEILTEGRLPLPIRYVITLDADTQLPPGTARRMVETIAHPLNRAETDPVTRVRKVGYSIIQPRVSIALPDATATRFTRLFADTLGTDPYCQTVSDAQQDLFGEAIFQGKAIYDVSAFRTALENRFPAETLLSHDLIEGAHAGVGLASDIEIYEKLPLDYVSFSRRQHRWIRGDWQIAPWSSSFVPRAGGGRERNPLSAMNRWRILDNLRRSLVPIASLWLLLFGWLISPAPGVWSLVVGLAIVIPALAPMLDQLARRVQGMVDGWYGAADELARSVVMIAFLPHQAWLSADAIVRTIYRRKISHKRLLEWQTAENAGSDSLRGLPHVQQQMLVIAAISLSLIILLVVKGTFAASSMFLLLWTASPAILQWLSGSGALSRRDKVNRADSLLLRGIARRTWRYFDDLVSSDRNWLPPDNSQLALQVEIAERTSPTNIGLWLASALSAVDFGYLTVDDLLNRCTQTLTTLNCLERYEGHLFNWYAAKTLEPLAPRYVSTVDSGNLIAGLWVLARGCHERVGAPLLGATCLEGMADTLSVLRELCGPEPSVAIPLRELRRLFRGPADGHVLITRLRAAVNPVQQLQNAGRYWRDSADERAYWISRLERELKSWIEVVDRYLAWIEILSQPPDSFLREISQDAVQARRDVVSRLPTLETLGKGNLSEIDILLALRGQNGLGSEASDWLDRLAEQYQLARAAASETTARLGELAKIADQFSQQINMRFLYDEKRQLFGVGYAVGSPAGFSSHYDLLASECRIASLVAIAKGDVPAEHWFALGRPLAATGSGKALLSWSGTMFEFLMPLLFTRSFANSLLDQTCRAAVLAQIDYCREKDVPWGISESAYSALDSHQIYQYRAFGIPALALKASPDEDPVVAPYATMLALSMDARDSIANLKNLLNWALSGPMGLYESIDFSREAKPDGKPGIIIYTYMAHHQAMSLIALDNLLHRDNIRSFFHADARIRAVESLLFERVPSAPLSGEPFQTRTAPIQPVAVEEPEEKVWKEDTAVPRVHIQGNGRYSVMVTNSGGGYTRWNGFDFSRWRSDTTRDSWGNFIYIRDIQSNAIWATSYHPAGGRLGTGSIRFSADRAEFHRNLNDIDTTLAITIAPDDDLELRRLTVANRSTRVRQLEFTSYVELALAPLRSDAFHPAFSKMFVETESYGGGVLIARRRPRSPDDHPIWAAHVLIGAPGIIQCETDRAAFLGRACSLQAPEAMSKDLTGSVGAVLDPIFSLRCRVQLEPRGRLELDFLTIAASSRESLLTLIAKYQRQEAVARAFEMAWTRAQLEFRYLRIGPSDAHRFQQLASHLLYPSSRLRAAGDRLARNRLGQSALWAYGISGDLPILVVTASENYHLALVREVLSAHSYWTTRGFQVDLVILNQEGPGYDRPLQQDLKRQLEAHSSTAEMDKPGGVYLREWHSIPEDHRNLLLRSASAVLHGARGSLQLQLATSGEIPEPPPFIPPLKGKESPSLPLPFLELPYFNGLGGFTPDGREYPIYLKPESHTPSPWANVMANPSFGSIVTESGLGVTWNGNSQSNRLTPWHNDPIGDPQSEVIYLRDNENGAFWTPTPLPIRERDAYRTRHGQNYTVFEHNSHGIGQELTVLVPLGDPVKLCRLRLRNDSGRPRLLTITFFVEWVLGSNREDQQLRIYTSRDEPSGAVLATQDWSGSYAGHMAFAAASPPPTSWTGDRTEFLGRNGSAFKPAALARTRLDNRTGAGLDPCAALQVSRTIDAGQQVDVTFLLGQAPTVEAVRELVGRYLAGGQVDETLAATCKWWDAKLGVLQFHTPLLSVDYLVNRWLPYQTLSCRFWGRAAIYQSSGAFGFRDQLQDCLAFLYMDPGLTRSHLLTSAARQFIEGDVQHWWHSETGLGIRTRCSDDMLWLPFAVAHYVAVTGDVSILDQQIPFLDGAPLSDTEQERVFVPAVSGQTATLREHCQRAINRAWRIGTHGLPLFGTGDWNDGMNRVGVEGRGESVWLAMFLYAVIQSFVEYLEPKQAAPLLDRAAQLATAIDRSCWDGSWYLRGFYDDGSPLGSNASQEAKIDSLSQSWAVISGAVDPARARKAIDSARRNLVDERNRLVLLLTPPFDHSDHQPGYIMGYPPGVRENGGQYTHGALWLASAYARIGEGDSAAELLKMMNPVESARDPKSVEIYRGEPYVVAGDVSSATGRAGRSGWTWYTGSAGWMYRIWIEEVLGFRLRGQRLTIAPVIPNDWQGFEITFRYRSSTYEITVRRRETAEPENLEIDGKRAGGNTILLVDDGAIHKVTLWLLPRVPAPSPSKEDSLLGSKVNDASVAPKTAK